MAAAPSLTERHQRLSANPTDATAWRDLAYAYRDLGDIPNAQWAYGGALQADPGDVQARWSLNRLLPRIYDNADHMQHWRNRAELAIALLSDSTHPTHTAEIADALAGLQTGPNFELAYHGQNDRPIQEKWGQMVCRVMAAAFPQIANRTLPNPAKHGRKLRIGYVSANFSRHTITLLFGHWILQADPQHFEIHVYLCGQGVFDSNTRLLSERCHRFKDVRDSLEHAVHAIAEDELDILVYPDLGMDSISFCLAGLRLAPVQCTSWGHPVTSGLPTIDYMLSSDLMEPEDCQDHYSEKLIRLPNLSIYYQFPPQCQALPRSKTGLPSGCLYLCCQALQKYHPGHDSIFTAIAAKVRDARFVFLLHARRLSDNKHFMDRLRRAFDAAGLSPDTHLIFVPWQPWDSFLRLAAQCDVFLDTLDWSGGNTALEALSQGLPIITLPGRFMRGRHCFAILRRIGLLDGIAQSVADYVEKAVRMGTDPTYRQTQRQNVLQNRHRLERDKDCLFALESFYKQIAR